MINSRRAAPAIHFPGTAALTAIAAGADAQTVSKTSDYEKNRLLPRVDSSSIRPIQFGYVKPDARRAESAAAADQAASAQTAVTAQSANSAQTAATAEQAARAGYADSAARAAAADWSATAQQAGVAGYANAAGSADSASTALNAVNAAYATQSAYSETAGRATLSDRATQADKAADADHAITADQAGGESAGAGCDAQEMFTYLLGGNAQAVDRYMTGTKFYPPPDYPVAMYRIGTNANPKYRPATWPLIPSGSHLQSTFSEDVNNELRTYRLALLCRSGQWQSVRYDLDSQSTADPVGCGICGEGGTPGEGTGGGVGGGGSDGP